MITRQNMCTLTDGNGDDLLSKVRALVGEQSEDSTAGEVTPGAIGCVGMEFESARLEVVGRVVDFDERFGVTVRAHVPASGLQSASGAMPIKQWMGCR